MTSRVTLCDPAVVICCYARCLCLDSRHEVYTGWSDFRYDVPFAWRRFIIEGVRGGRSREEDVGDIAIDDVILSFGKCPGIPIAVQIVRETLRNS